MYSSHDLAIPWLSLLCFAQIGIPSVRLTPVVIADRGPWVRALSARVLALVTNENAMAHVASANIGAWAIIVPIAWCEMQPPGHGVYFTVRGGFLSKQYYGKAGELFALEE